jgi:hypothetical protein
LEVLLNARYNLELIVCLTWSSDGRVAALLVRERTRIKIDVKATFPAYH